MLAATLLCFRRLGLVSRNYAGVLGCGVALICGATQSGLAGADEPATETATLEAPVAKGQEAAAAESRTASAPNVSELVWHAEYATARESAKKNRRMLLILFTDAIDAEVRRSFLGSLEQDPDVRALLERYERAWLTRKSSVRIGADDVPLLEHNSFRDMLGRCGLAVVDFRDPQNRFYHQVVSVYPFGAHDPPQLGNNASPPQVGPAEAGRASPMGPWISLDEFSVLLDLPEGSLTQRTLIFAVRTHPDNPASASGEASELLMSEAESHSRHQADLRVQGHHNWGSRFQRITNLLPGNLLAQEVCAESWPGQPLLDAARECVRSWRQSDGHWDAVQRRHRLFGYDMKAGANGVWYATGIFGRNR